MDSILGELGRSAHEMIIDCRDYKEEYGIGVMDIAKRLIDYGFHAPTVSFPVPGTMMIEPTESENLDEIDRFCDALISIKAEIITCSKDDTHNILKNSPHTLETLTAGLICSSISFAISFDVSSNSFNEIESNFFSISYP